MMKFVRTPRFDFNNLEPRKSKPSRIINFLRKNLTETRVLGIGLVSILLFAIVAALFGPRESGSNVSTRDKGPDGARALRTWLEKSEYDVRELTALSLDPGEADVLFVLDPRYEVKPEDARRVQRWVRQGNTLIAAGNTYNLNSLLEPYDVKLQYWPSDGLPHAQTSPTLIYPPFDELILGASYSIESSRPDLVVHMMHNGVPIVASLREGEGQVWVLGTVYAFTNRGLDDEDSGKFILNLLMENPPPAIIAFDEALHDTEQRPMTMSAWVRGTPAGLSILSAVILTMAFLALQGRRFGRPFPLREDRLLREPVEYIKAMANLLRRSGQRAATIEHYRHQLKRALAKRYAIDPRLADDDMVKQIAARDRSMDTNDLYALFFALKQKQISEADLVRIATEVDETIRKLS